MAKLYEEIFTHRTVQNNQNNIGTNTLELHSTIDEDGNNIGLQVGKMETNQADGSSIGGNKYIYPESIFGQHAGPMDKAPDMSGIANSPYSLNNDSISSLYNPVDNGGRQGLYQQYETHSLDHLPQRKSNISSRSENVKRKFGPKGTDLEGDYHPQPKPVKMAKPPAIRQSSFPVGNKKFPVLYNDVKSLSSSPKNESLFASNDDFDKFFDFSHNDTHAIIYNNGIPKKTRVEGSMNNVGYRDPSGGINTGINQRKGRNPGFHIPLDNISGVDKGYVAKNPTFKRTGFHSSTHSDSSIEKTFPGNSNELKFEDNDLLFTEEDKFNYDSIITPSMKPPGTNQDNYFEFDNKYQVEGTQSPHVGSLNQSSTGHEARTKEMESYLMNNYSEILKDSTNPSVNASIDDFHPDLSGFNFDVNPKTSNSSPGDFLNLMSFEEGSNTSGTSNNPEPAKETPDVEREPLSKSYFLNLTRPTFERTGSNQSVASLSSISSKDRERQKKKRTPKGAVCTICDKYISRDLTRHMRIHNEVGRFQCVYPKPMCNHKTQYFNRPYDYKKHLLHVHFKFDDPKGKSANTLTDKLPIPGTCVACGARFVANDWLEKHILIDDVSKRCPLLEK